MLETLHETLGGPLAFAMVFARAAGLVWALAWLVGAAGAGLRVRLAAAAVVAAAAAPLVVEAVPVPDDPLAIGLRAIGEAAAGAAIGLGAGLIAAAARLAGEVVGLQAGLAAAHDLDPAADDGPAAGAATPTATLAGLVALATFAALDGPFRLLMALVASYRVESPSDGLAALAFEAVGRSLGLAVQLAMPATLALLSAQISVGLLARAAPAVSAFTAWLPVRLAIGLVIALVGVAGLATALAAAWSNVLPAG